MKTVGAFDAKTHLNALLKRVSRGETIRITLRGVPIAMLVPANDKNEVDPDQLVRDIRALRKGAVLNKTSIRALIDEGRRY
ncbi:MAG TPA: type II toxin-antitoxin system prevent-host-death family antitoxin [Terriglobales bacterium]|nr:type II toxin-antitoxin system prevent-host-death family antitoxin [Terriglobales bacterium]